MHSNGKIAVIISANCGKADKTKVATLLRQFCMHAAAMKPQVISYKDLSLDFVEKECVALRAELAKENEELKRLGKPLNHIPEFASRLQLSDEQIKKAEDEIKDELRKENKPEKIWDKIIPGKLSRFIADNTILDQRLTLLSQFFVMDDKKTIEEVIADASKELGDKIEITGYVRYEVGEGLEKSCSTNWLKMELLKGENLTHAFDYTLFENINLTINSGESVAILGVSGCGKSTLLHIFSTLLRPNFGEIYFDGRGIYSLNDDERVKIRRDKFGIIFQSHYLFKGFSAYENIELSSTLTNQKIDTNLIEKLQISHILKNKVGDLSGGQQQRVSIARVLCKRPKIIFADEPTGNLDQNTAHEVMSVIFDYVRENSGGLMLVTHDENIAKSCSKIYRLHEKKLELL